MPSFGNSSKSRLKGACAELILVANDSIHIIDFSVIETVRGQSEQDKYFETGASTLQWPDSKHNVCKERPLAEAMDLWPYVPPFGTLSGHPDQIAAITAATSHTEAEVKEFVYKAYARLAGTVEACAVLRGFRVRWGGDWDGDGDLLDQNFHDLPHFELIR